MPRHHRIGKWFDGMDFDMADLLQLRMTLMERAMSTFWKRTCQNAVPPDARWHQESVCPQDASKWEAPTGFMRPLINYSGLQTLLECSDWSWKLIAEEQLASISSSSYGIENVCSSVN